MIIINSDNYPQGTLTIRKTKSDAYSYYALVLKHNVTGRIFIYMEVNESANPHYFKFTIDLSGLPFGEYTYYIAGAERDYVINIDTDNILNSYYAKQVAYLGARSSNIFISQNMDLAIRPGSDGFLPLDFLQICLLQLFTFNTNIINHCNTFNVYECCKTREAD